MSDALQELDGVGPARADELTDAGFDTIAAVAAASAETIADETSISEGTAESLVADAEDLSGEETLDTDVEIEEVTGDETDEPTEVVDDNNTDTSEDTVTVELTDNDEDILHVLHIVLEEATSQRQSSNRLMQQATYDVAEQLAAQIASDTETYTVSGDRDELNALYRALSSGEHDYAGRAGIPSLYGRFRSMKEDVNDARSEL